MAIRQLDVLHVRTFSERVGNPVGNRVVIDLDEDPGTDRFIVLNADGAFICIGMERVQLGWPALVQLAELLSVARKTLKPR